MSDPLKFLTVVSAKTDHLYLWTSFIDLEGAGSNDPVAADFNAHRREIPFMGITATLYPRSYQGSELNPSFCGGIYDSPQWMSKQSILDVLTALGFDQLQMAHEATPHPIESCLSIFARRSRHVRLEHPHISNPKSPNG